MLLSQTNVSQKFSLQGGMGAALLKDPQRAAAIVHTLASNLPHKPISAKIRLLDTLDETIAFMRALEEAGAAAITGTNEGNNIFYENIFVL